MKHRFTAPFFAVLVLALAAFTGSALAGSGGGNGSDGSNGNSANAPGQTKADQAPAAPAAAASTKHADKQSSTQVSVQASAQASTQSSAHDDKQSSTSATAPATGGSNSQGVKPSNETDHDTYALASSDKTKVYGNGKTAGQIATQAGQGNAVLHGPGNSQPHKTAPCPGGHEVDVHALKHKSSAACASSPQPQVVTPVTPTPAVTATVTPAVAATVTPTVTPTVVTPAAAAVGAVQAAQPTSTPASSAPAAAPAAAAGVKGVAVALKPTKTKPASGVLGTTTKLGGTAASSKLPFTGLPLSIFALVAVGLIGVGLTMRRAAANRV